VRAFVRSVLIAIALAGAARAGGGSSRVSVVTLRGAETRASDVRVDGAVVGTVLHAPLGQGAVIRADALRDRRAAVVVLDEDRGRIRDWGGALVRVGEGATRLLAHGVYHASRPLASVDGLVYIERGAPGALPTEEEARRGRLRVDPIRIDAIDPDSGASRAIYAWSGYTLHVAGEWESELIVYRLGPLGADLVGIDRASGRARVVAALLPFARDFAVDHAGGAILLTNRDEKDSHLWIVLRVDLATGASTRLAEKRDETPALPAGPWLGDVR
jgi:hypothetical protein